MPRHAHHVAHWGAYSVEADGAGVVAVEPHPEDRDPSPLLGNVAAGARSARVERPTVRRGWWEDGPGPDARRGADEWLTVEWDEALDRVAAELARVRDAHGPDAVYAGSYGWASAGRFHHAQSQLRRFFGLYGGATVSVGSYSTGAAEVLLPHVVGDDEEVWRGATAWPVIARHTELLVAFGGIPAKNSTVSPGGVTEHRVAAALRAAVGRGMRIELLGPLADDISLESGAVWHPLRPATDVAVMLGLAHVLLSEDLADLDFCSRCCVGTDRLAAYVLGRADGVAKTPEWAAGISQVPAPTIRDLARRMAGCRTLVTTSWSLQRTRFGEQPLWMSIALACLLGQVGLPGGGFGHGYGSLADVGGGRDVVRVPALPGATRGLRSWIPVARVADMLLDPGGAYDFDGQRRTYPDVRVVYWAGGNPFHHHQDVNRLRQAWRRPDTVVVHESHWTAAARHSDVVLPATVTLEREDIASGRGDGRVHAMQRALDPYGEARDDYTIFAGLAERLGVGPAFTEGRDAGAWLHDMYGRLSSRLSAAGLGPVPSFEEFWAAGEMALPSEDDDRVLYAAFRADPVANPLATPSGRIELWSDTIAGFGYDDCPPQPRWIEPEEWLGAPAAARWPLHLVANNPATRLHSQLDPGETSRRSKVAGREPLRMHPNDAAARRLRDGDVVRASSERGSCLAGLIVTPLVRPGVVQLSTGAWYDPDDPGAERPLCRHGNPNVLTADRPSSRLSQGCAGQHALVQVERYEGAAPAVRAWEPPPATSSARG
ncbi:MAG: molybdopterin-dependent oxidoreductase [Acidimicrobiales bacterium]